MVSSDFSDTAYSLLREELARGNPITVSIGTSSMSPSIRPGDSVLVAPATPEGLRRGDLVLIDNGEAFIVHRLLAMKRGNGTGLALTRGDGVRRFDEPVPADRIVGKVLKIHRANGVTDLSSPARRCGQRIAALYFLWQGYALQAARKIKSLLGRGTE